MKPDDDEILNSQEASDLLRVNIVTLRALAPKLGRKVGREWRFKRSALMKYLDRTK